MMSTIAANSRFKDDALVSPRVTAVIVAYHSAEIISRLLATLPADMKVVVADASHDPELAALQSHDPLEVVALDRNRGFGAAVNAGMGRVDTEFGLVLNPDMLLYPGCVAGCVADCVAAADRAPDAGLLSSEARGQRQDLADADWTAGCFMLLRTDAFRAVDGFDEDFFLYFEDRDLCVRLNAAGCRVVKVAGVRPQHVGGVSTNATHDNASEKLWLWGGGAAVFIDKHRGDRHGGKVRDRLRSMRLRRYGQALIGAMGESRAARIRVAGADAVRRHGPPVMKDIFFTGGPLRSAQPLADMRVGEH
jgi:N-acetylglucosaminyl-diphospho-decaprenol L-rhamnosyltransferase